MERANKFEYDWERGKFTLNVEDPDQAQQLRIVIARRVSSIIIYTRDWKSLNSDDIHYK